MNKDLSKQDLYEGVKILIDNEDCEVVHLNQHKLYTLFSVGFQYLLYKSTKEPGAYIIRIEDSAFADKLARKSKDSSTRKFLNSLIIPRKLKYGQSTFFLDYFHIGSWNMTNEIPQDKIKGTLIIKNSAEKPMDEKLEEDPNDLILAQLPKDYYYSMLRGISKKILLIAYEQDFDDVQTVHFPFIKDKEEKLPNDVKISKDIKFDE